MKKYLIVLFLILNSSFCFSQKNNCPTITDSFYYINVSIWTNNEYPIFMDAITKDLKIDSLCFKNTNEFLESLYDHSFYISQMPNGNRKAILKCLGDSLGRIYFKDNELALSSTGATIKKNSYLVNYKLTSKEDVTLKISKISGTFLEVSKSSELLTSNSNELPLSDIKNISNCYIPFNVQIKKVKKKLK